MSFVATTRVSILRGEGADAYGDPIDLDTQVASGIPASIIESQSRPQRPVDGRTDNVRSYTMRVRRNVSVRRDDRVRDLNSGVVYVIDEVVTPVNPVGHGAVRVVLRRVT